MDLKKIDQMSLFLGMAIVAALAYFLKDSVASFLVKQGAVVSE